MRCDFPEGAAIVFGGSGGIGQGVARAFAGAGSAVAICYNRRQDAAETVAGQARGCGVAATTHRADVREFAGVAATIDAAVQAHGRVHTLVWAAGPVVPQIHLAEWTDRQFRDAMETEAFGFCNAVRAAIPHFRTQGGGSFVHLGSAGHDWWPKLDGLSVVPKAVNEALVKGIAKEEGRHEIRANSVLVGVIDAGQFPLGQEAGYFDAAWERETKKLLALPRWGTPADIGNAVTFLASRQAGYITGQTISVSGGFGV